MQQQSLFSGKNQERCYTWLEGISAGGNPYFRLLEEGEETRWWVRHRINCKSGEPYFIVTGFGTAYVGGTFADVSKAKDTLIAIKDGKMRV